jgi:Raf kinase inhibitor-like YbhB/YbcL family protein
MKKLSLVIALLCMASLTFAQQPARKLPMVLTTAAFADGTVIPLKYTQAAPDGGVSPDLIWNTVPAGTQSFVLWMHDVDLALNKTSEDNIHWLVWNIPGQATTLPEKMPVGAQLPDGTYQISYSGPNYKGPGAPANGPLHHYIFELYALDIKLDEKAGANVIETKTNIFKLMQGHILGKAAYVGLFHRPQ